MSWKPSGSENAVEDLCAVLADTEVREAGGEDHRTEATEVEGRRIRMIVATTTDVGASTTGVEVTAGEAGVAEDEVDTMTEEDMAVVISTDVMNMYVR